MGKSAPPREVFTAGGRRHHRGELALQGEVGTAGGSWHCRGKTVPQGEVGAEGRTSCFFTRPNRIRRVIAKLVKVFKVRQPF